MKERACDVAVIGAGTAGISAHREALKAGVDSVLIEKGPGGTTCARVGCMPSKLLVTAASAAFDARDAGTFGVRIEGVHVDGRAVLARVRGLRDRFVGSVLEGLDALPAESRITGTAVFENATTLVIDDHTRLRFRAAIIATGSTPSVPPPLRELGARVLTTDTVFELEDLPESLAVLGGGPVGLELAQAMARLDVRTELFDPSSALGGLKDPDLIEAAHAIFGKEMILRLGSKVERSVTDGDGAVLDWSSKDGPNGSGSFARVLAAAGRPPNLTSLGLDRTGLTLDGRGSPAFDSRSLRCKGAGTAIFIAGDANQVRPVLHEANRQGRIAGRNASLLARSSEERAESPEPLVNLAMVFTHPQIAIVGSGYEPDAKDRITGRADLSDQGRARIMARNHGGLRLYADRAGRLVGAEMLGPEIEHLAHILAFAIQDGHTAKSLLDRPFYHPTLEEGLETALSDVARQV